MGSAMSSGSGAMNSYQEGKAQESLYKRQGEMALLESKMQQEASRRKTQQLTSTQRALYAKAGVDISSGSPLLIMSDTAKQGELEAQNIAWQGREKYIMYKHYARMARTAGNAGAVTQGIQTGITVASMIAGGVAGGMAGGLAGGVQGAMQGGSGGSGSGQAWGSFISAFANRQNYGLGTVNKSPYSGRYYNQ